MLTAVHFAALNRPFLQRRKGRAQAVTSCNLPPQLNIGQKGFALICTLLTCQLIFLSILFGVVENAERQAQKAEQAAELVGECNLLIKMYWDAGRSLGAYVATSIPKYSTQFDKNIKRIPPQMTHLKALLVRQGYSGEKIAKLEQPILVSLSTLQDYKHQVETTGDADIKQLREKITPPIEEVVSQLRSFVKEKAALERITIPDLSRQLRNDMKLVVLGGIVVNIIMGFGAILLVTKNITKRLSILTDNAGRLAIGAPLNSPVKGSDEIAHLDSVFHTMAQKLELAIRQERESARAMQASEERVRGIIQTMPVGLLEVDSRGVIKSVNRKTVKLLGMTRRILVGKSLQQLLTFPQDCDNVVHFLSENALDKSVECKASKNDGTTFPVELSVSEFDSAGNGYYLVNIIDITERHEAERLKREFVAMVSHDLRTPLTSVQAALCLLSAGAVGELTEPAQQVVGTAEHEVERLTKLVVDLLDVSKIEAGRMNIQTAPFSLQSMLHQSVRAVKHVAEKRGISFSVQPSSAQALADKERIVQVVVNLLSNAIKYSPDNGLISICTKENSGWIEVSITDRGRGIPKAFQNVIFERYKQVNPTDAIEKQGTGLGLAICKTIIEQHGGTIGVTSEPGEGATFWFRIRSNSNSKNESNARERVSLSSLQKTAARRGE